MSSGLEMNKIAAAILVSGLIAMIAGMVADGLYHGEKPAEKRGYSVAGAEEAGGDAAGGDQASAAPVDILPFLAVADAAAGEAVHKKCVSCHTFDKGGKHGVGPNLFGIVGAGKAHADDFSYSKGFADLKGKDKWDFQKLSEFLTSPQKYIPGTKMGFAGIKKPEERANLIAYLNSLSDSPQALPKAADHPMAAPGAATEPAAAAKPAEKQSH